MPAYRNKVTYLSFSLSVLVMLRHCVNIEIYGLTQGWLYWLEVFLRDLSDIAVPTFFMMSGYLFFQNYTPAKLLTKWKSRVFSIVIPYLIWNLLAFLFVSLINLIPFVRSNMTKTIEPFTLEWIVKNMLFGYHNITWFLQNIMVYSFIGPLLFPILKSKPGCFLLFAAALVYGMISADCYGIAYNAVFYLPGVYIGIHHRDFFQKRYSKKIMAGAFALLFVSVALNAGLQVLDNWSRLPVRHVQAFLLWIVADVLAVEATPRWWMTISFVIYCSHTIILESVEKVFLLLFGKNLLGAALDFFLAPLITLCIIIACSAVCRKIKPLWNLLSGNR